MYTIEHTIETTAPASDILRALTTEAGYRAWWTQTATFDGRHATFTFAKPTCTRKMTFLVDRSDARGIAMTCTASENNPDWLGTKLAISLEGGRVRLVHAGYPEKNENFDQCVQGWSYFMASLKSYLETGRGTPYVLA